MGQNESIHQSIPEVTSDSFSSAIRKETIPSPQNGGRVCSEFTPEPKRGYAVDAEEALVSPLF